MKILKNMKKQMEKSKINKHKFHDGYCELCNEHSSVSHKGLYVGGDSNGDDWIINAANLVRMVRFINKEEVIVY